MSASLRLRITDYQNPDHFRWQLEDDSGRFLADHDARLDAGQMAYQGYADLPAFLRHYFFIHPETDLLTMAGEHVFGKILPAIVQNATPPLTTVAVLAPSSAQSLLERPLELARWNGKSLTEQRIRLIYTREDAAAPTRKQTGEALRILAVFSLPDDGSPLNLRQERHELERFARSLQADDKAVELRVLQYGATRDTLRDALKDGDGWDILHFSGHGHKGVLALEKPDGAADIVTTDQLQTLLEETKGRVCLVFLSACLSGATTLQAARRALGLDAPARDDKRDADADATTAQATALTNLGHALAEGLDSAVIAMRYKVGDRFAADLANVLYAALLTDRQPLPRALHTSLADARIIASAADFPLSPFTPILFGERAADLRITLRERPFDSRLSAIGMDAFPPEPERFVGRLRPMRLGQEAIAREGQQRGVLYYGMAGGGKTTIATELAYRYRKGRFRGFVWYKAPPENDGIVGEFARFLSALYYQLGLTDTALLENADRPEEFNRRTLPRLRQFLRHHACLIVLDNLEGLLTSGNDWRDPAWGPLLDTLLDAQSHSRLILTSRRVPNTLAALSQLTLCPVHALSLPEAILLARDLPHLKGLFADEAGKYLLQWTLRLVQGHPKLLEFADGLSADRAALQAHLTQAESAAEGNASLQAFFETGESTREEPQFMQAFTGWMRGLAESLSLSARLLFRFLACLEEEDRNLSILEATWSLFLSNAPDDLPGIAKARADAKRSLTAGLRELTELGLVETQTLPLPPEAPADTPLLIRYALHPAVAETVRQDVSAPLRTVADRTISGLHLAYFQHFVDHETDGYSATIVNIAKRTLPYLVRQEAWEMVAALADQIVLRDQSAAMVAQVLPLLERATDEERKAGGAGSSVGILARVLSMAGRMEEAEAELHTLVEQAAKRGDYNVASALAGDLTNLMLSTGRYEEALVLVTQEIAYAKQAGAGPWTLLGKEIRRLQIGNALGHWQETLIAGKSLLEHMANLPEIVAPEQNERSRPYNVREFLLNTLLVAAHNAEQYEQALRLNADIIQSKRSRRADIVEIARSRFNDSGSLRQLRRYEEARMLLRECRDAFANAGSDQDIGKVYTALANLEADLSNLTAAVGFVRQGLLHNYRASDPNDCAMSHNNLANYHEGLRQLAEARAHRLAAIVIGLQIQSGEMARWLHNLALDDLSGTPPAFDWMAEIVEQVPGVRFRELFARLPKTALDGDAAIAAAWEMAKQEQARMAPMQAVVAGLPPAVRAALEAGDMEAFNTALAQLSPEEAQAVVQRMTDGMGTETDG